MTHRPKYASGHDANHFIVRDFLLYTCGGGEDHRKGKHVVYLAYLQGVRVGAIDTSGLGGLWLDWLCFASDQAALVEVKTPEAYRTLDNGLEPDEIWTIANLPLRSYVVATDEQVQTVYHDLLRVCREAAEG